ncbi:MAG: transcriptional repressor LexA, partial [Candidatus Peregrinibacteria bacterium]|nr:transcriptional repressor LexA [Candidatus Peregrinibacteria bacterium]
EHFGVSSDNSVLKHLKALEEKGYIEKDDTPRGIKLLSKIKEQLEAAANVACIPLLGTIPAGGAVEAEENILGTFEVGRGLMKTKTGSYLLRVTGSSMIDAGIYEGDMVLVSPEQNPRHGDVVVALVDGENTVKRYMNERGKIYLKAENPEYENIYPTQQLEVQGVVNGLIRNY